MSLVLFADSSLMSLSSDQTVNIWNTRNGSLIRLFAIDSKSIIGVSQLTDGSVATQNSIGYNSTNNIEIWI